MTSDKNDQRIRRLFEQLRATDEAPPGFSAVLKGRARRRHFGSGWLQPARVVLAGLIGLAIGLTVWFRHPEQSAGSPGSETLVVEMLEWESPTDFLLHFEQESLLSSVPSLDAELSDWTATETMPGAGEEMMEGESNEEG